MIDIDSQEQQAPDPPALDLAGVVEAFIIQLQNEGQVYVSRHFIEGKLIGEGKQMWQSQAIGRALHAMARAGKLRPFGAQAWAIVKNAPASKALEHDRDDRPRSRIPPRIRLPDASASRLPAPQITPARRCPSCGKPMTISAYAGEDGLAGRTMAYCKRCNTFHW